MIAVTMVIASNTEDVRAISVGSNFVGVSFSQTNFFPPDSMGAVGPSHVSLVANGRFAVFDREGRSLVGKSLNQFWIDSGVTPLGDFAFDPRLLFDSYSARWFAAAVDNRGQPNNFLLAVSSSSDPTDSWSGFQIDSDTSDQTWADFPTLGINGDVLVLSANMLPVENTGSGVNVFVMPKQDLTAALPSLSGATLLAGSGGGTTPQPAVDLDGGSLPLPILSDFLKPFFGQLIKSDLAGTASTPSIELGRSVFVTPAEGPPQIDQPGSKTDIDGGDTRFSGNVILQNGSLWAVHGVESAGRAAVEWYEIDPQSNVVLQNGVISDSSLGFNFPSIAVNDYDDVVIGFSGGDPATFMSSYAVVGQTIAGVTRFGPVTQLAAGLADYEITDDFGRNRWGDYSATVVDPVNEKHFWTFQEIASAPDEWSVQVTQLIVPEPSLLIHVFLAFTVMSVARSRATSSATC